MGFLDRAIRRGVSDAVSKAVGGAVREAVTPVAEKYANKAAAQIDQAAAVTSQQLDQSTAAMQGAAQQSAAQSGGFANLESALGNWQRSMESYATEAAKNIKTCPACGEAATADKKFCPSCGAKLPEQTLAQGAVCPSCGKQNTIGTRFCQECGAKLPSAVAEEQAAADKNAAALAKWDALLPQYPKWSCGGSSFEIEHSAEYGYTEFIAVFTREYDAQKAVEQYRSILMQNGFCQAGQYPDRCHLYRRINGVCFHVDTEHCFDGGSERASIYFNNEEPAGGFDYVKPQPRKKQDLFDLFK